MAENLVASTFFRMKEMIHTPLGIFYDPESEGVDFLLTNISNEVIPVEVSVGDKNIRQVKRAINKYDSEYGILISNATRRITRKDNVIYIPLTTFSFL